MTPEQQLKKDYGLQRDKLNNIGKRIGNDVWFHKQYINQFIENSDNYLTILPTDFSFEVVRFNAKDNIVTFIESTDFNSSHEPLVGRSISIHSDKDELFIKSDTKPSKKPLIYHHKWLFVADDYQGFDVAASKERSLAWKHVAGKDRVLSSKIGRLDFWNAWLSDNGLEPRKQNSAITYLNQKIEQSVWNTYLNNDYFQSESSKNTARIQKPRTLKMLQKINKPTKNTVLMDLGCGIGNEVFSKELADLGITYFGVDPFNKTQETNLAAISQASNGRSDFVTINNVLNTIPEQSVWVDILKQAENCISDDGVVLTLIYEGEKNATEKALEKEKGKKTELTPIKTRDGWQNRAKTETYLETVKSIFPNSSVVKTVAGKVILSSKDESLDLKKLFQHQLNNKLI